MRLKIPPRGLVGHFCPKNLAKLLKMRGQRCICFSKYVTPMYKRKEDFVYWFVLRKKLSHFFFNLFSFSLDLYFKNMCKTGKFWDPKIRAQRWIWFSQYTIPIGKLRDFIVIWHVRNKKLLYFCKLIL